MFFKSATIFQFNKDFELNEFELADKLKEHAFAPCGTHDANSAGWMGVLGKDSELYYAAQGNILLRLGMQEKILPASVVKEQFEERVAELESKGRRLRKQDKEALKEEVQAFLIPRAFAKTSTISAYIDRRHKLLVVDSTSQKQIDLFLDKLRNTIGALPVSLPKTDEPDKIMTQWVLSNDYPETLTLHDSCTLQADSGANTATIKCSGYDLLSDNIKAFISEGGRITALSPSYQDQISLTLTEDLTFKSIKFLDVIKTANDDITADTQAERLAADFLIMSESISELAEEILTVFGAEQYDVKLTLDRTQPEIDAVVDEEMDTQTVEEESAILDNDSVEDDSAEDNSPVVTTEEDDHVTDHTTA